jgi:tetratricopeptide repeat protein
MRWGIMVVVVLVGGLASGAPNDRERARLLYRQGTQHYNLGEFEQALGSFKEVYRIVEDPALLFNIGQCQRMIGQKAEAIRSFRAYLRESHEVSNRETVEKIMTDLERELRDEATPARPLTPAPSPPPHEDARPAAVPTPQPIAVTVSAPVPEPPRKRLSRGAVAGIIVGTVLVVGGVVAVGVVLGTPAGTRDASFGVIGLH